VTEVTDRGGRVDPPSFQPGALSGAHCRTEGDPAHSTTDPQVCQTGVKKKMPVAKRPVGGAIASYFPQTWTPLFLPLPRSRKAGPSHQSAH